MRFGKRLLTKDSRLDMFFPDWSEALNFSLHVRVISDSP